MDGSAPEPRSGRGIVFWSSALSAVWAVVFDVSIGLGAAGAPTRLAAIVASLLLALTFLVLVSAVHSLAHPLKRVWTQIALSFALVYAALLVWNYYLQLTVVRTNPSTYPWLSMEFTSSSAFWSIEVIGYTLLGLATLFMLPVVPRDRLGSVIRWSFFANGLFTVVGGIGYALSGEPLNILVLLSLGVWAIAFPLGTGLFSVTGGRALRAGADRPTSEGPAGGGEHAVVSR